MPFDPSNPASAALANILNEIGARLFETALPHVAQASVALAEALKVEVDFINEITYVEVPHYWALYIHDGRKPFQAKRTNSSGKRLTFLVWFADPRNDPRLRNGYPVRETDIVHLSKEDFEKGMDINRERFKSGGQPYMFVAKWHPGSPPNKFFEEGCAPVLLEIPEIIDLEIQKMADAIGKEVSEKGRARFRLR